MLRRCQDRFDIICQRWTLKNDFLCQPITNLNRHFECCRFIIVHQQKLCSCQTNHDAISALEIGIQTNIFTFLTFVDFQICWWICDDSQVLTFSRPWPLVLLLPFLQHVQSNNEQLYAGFLLPFFQCSHTSTLCGWISIEFGVELLKLILSLLLWLALELEFEFVALKFGDQMDSFSRRRGGSEGFM